MFWSEVLDKVVHREQFGHEIAGVVPPEDTMGDVPVTEVTQVVQVKVLSADKSPPPPRGEVVLIVLVG